MGSALLFASLSVDACHRAPPGAIPQTGAPCRATQQHDDGRIHIDGPGMNTPDIGDSLVIVVNDHEAWRGVYDPCHPSPGRDAALDHVIPATDSVISLEFVHGPDVGARFHIGGKRAAAYVIRTAPPPE